MNRAMRHIRLQAILAIFVFATTIFLPMPAAASAATPFPPTFHGSEFNGSSQVIVIQSSTMHNVNAVVSAYQKRGDTWEKVFDHIPALIGRNGMQYDRLRKQDTDTTPSGVYAIPFAFGWASNPGSAISYRAADANSYWNENSGSPTYNRWVEGNPGGECERLATQPLYKYALVLNYNWNQIPGKGAGIFIHLIPQRYTGGCVGINESSLVSIMRWLKPGQNPRVLICQQCDFGRYYYADPGARTDIDVPRTNAAIVSTTLTETGWVLNRSGISRVDLYAYDSNSKAHWLGSVPGDQLTARPDVKKAFPAYNTLNSGYSFTADIHDLKSGKYTLAVAGIGNDGSVQWATQCITVGPNPRTDIDTPRANTTVSSAISVKGWVLNRSGISRVDLYVYDSNNKAHWLGSVPGNQLTARPDVKKAFPAYNTLNSGYCFTADIHNLKSGKYTLAVAGIGNNGNVVWSTTKIFIK